MTASWTAIGHAEVNEQISETVRLLADVVRKTVPEDRLRVAAIIGGYGRGEGGVVERETSIGPHNNIDLLLVSRRGPVPCDIRNALDTGIAETRQERSVPVDVGWISENRLRFARPRVMWYDVRFGHRVVRGDSAFLTGLERFRADNIPGSDVVDLLTNRATLLVIARMLLDVPEPSKHALETAVRSTAKAIIGVGDALLWQQGEYHYSYREKLRRMRLASGLPRALRELYVEAAEFRFHANYEAYRGRERQWVARAKEVAEESHLEFARRLLGVRSWDRYRDRLLKYCAKTRAPREWISHIRASVRSGTLQSPTSSDVLGMLSLPRHRIAAQLPGALYESVANRDHMKQFIGDWAKTSDINFPSRLRTELGLEEVAA